jgi:hypothetical protein|nr:choice-of-anchor J domain-containing protein [Candidatus Krumholzibacteria bacterium]
MKPQSRGLLTMLILLCLPGVLLAGITPQDQTVNADRDLFLEGFEGSFPPAGWAIIHLGNTYQWQSTTAASHTGARSALLHSGGVGQPQDEWLVTAPLDLSTTVAPKLEWYEEENNWNLGDHHYIAVSTTSQTDPEAFTMIHTMTPATHTVAGFGGAPVTLDLSAYAGEPTVYVAFRYVGEYADWWIVDDVRIFELLGRDIMPLAIAPADNHFEEGSTLDPVVTVYNNGEQGESFDVTLEILESGTPVYSETISVLTLGSDSELQVSFPSHTVSAGKLIKMVATTSLDGDENSLNNTVTSYNESYTQAHTPLGLLFTNAGCGPCVQANQALDAYVPTQGNDIAVIRLHVSWPGADIMYSANSAQSNYMVTDYGVGGVPAFYLDGVENTNSGAAFPGLFAGAQQGKVPMRMELRFDPDLEQTIVTVKNLEQMRDNMGPLKLRVVITEDNVYYAGSNGETHHSQAMRYIFPDVYGLDVPTTLGDHQFVVDTPLNGSWVYDNLRATVFLQDMDSRSVLQSGTDFLTNIDEATSPVQDQMVRPYQLAANYPNPFNPSTTISFKLPRNEQAELVIYSVDGARVTTLINEQMAEGAHSVTWTGRNDAGQQVASGTYFYQLRTPSFSETRMMTLIK